MNIQEALIHQEPSIGVDAGPAEALRDEARIRQLAIDGLRTVVEVDKQHNPNRPYSEERMRETLRNVLNIDDMQPSA